MRLRVLQLREKRVSECEGSVANFHYIFCVPTAGLKEITEAFQLCTQLTSDKVPFIYTVWHTHHPVFLPSLLLGGTSEGLGAKLIHLTGHGGLPLPSLIPGSPACLPSDCGLPLLAEHS